MGMMKNQLNKVSSSRKFFSLHLPTTLMMMMTMLGAAAAWHDSNSFILNCCWCISGIRAPVHICSILSVWIPISLSLSLSFYSSLSSPPSRSFHRTCYDISSSCSHINNFFSYTSIWKKNETFSTLNSLHCSALLLVSI